MSQINPVFLTPASKENLRFGMLWGGILSVTLSLWYAFTYPSGFIQLHPTTNLWYGIYFHILHILTPWALMWLKVRPKVKLFYISLIAMGFQTVIDIAIVGLLITNMIRLPAMFFTSAFLYMAAFSSVMAVLSFITTIHLVPIYEALEETRIKRK